MDILSRNLYVFEYNGAEGQVLNSVPLQTVNMTSLTGLDDAIPYGKN